MLRRHAIQERDGDRHLQYLVDATACHVPCYLSIPWYLSPSAACGVRKHGHWKGAPDIMPMPVNSAATQGCWMSAPLQFYLVQHDLATTAQHCILHDL